MSQDITEILGEPYATYPGESVGVGVICIAVIPYVMNNCYTIQPLNADPQSDDHQKYTLVQKKPSELASNNQEKWNLPIKDLGLDVNEDLLIVKVKRRPVVVLSRAIVDERKVEPSKFQDLFWCIPSYTLMDQHFHPQFDKTFIEDVSALSYRSCFPLPYDSHLHDRMAMLRIDRTQPIPRYLLKPTERRLSKEWTVYLQEWARFYMTGQLGDDDNLKNPESVASILGITRDLLMEELAKKRTNPKD